MSKPSLLILAAGIGSRYGGFKQIDPIGPNGEIIIDYSVFDALRTGFGKIVMLTRPELEAPIRDHFRETLGPDLDIEFIFQQLDDLPPGFAKPPGREKPWGTGHAIWAARGAIDAPFAVINADDFYGAVIYKVLHNFLARHQPGEYALAGFEIAKTLSEHGFVSRGICQADASGCLVEVIEHTKIERDGASAARTLDQHGNWQPIATDSIASMNLWAFDPSVMPNLESLFRDFLTTHPGDLKAEFFIPNAVDAMIKSGKVRCKVLRTGEQWFGVTYKADRDLAAGAIRQLIASGVYPESLRDAGQAAHSH